MMKFNFLPHRLRQQQERRQRFHWLLCGAMLAGVIFVAMAALLLDNQVTQQTLLVQLMQAEHSKLDVQLRRAGDLEKQIVDLTQRQQHIIALHQQQNKTTQLFQTLANQTPPELQLRTLKQQANHIALTGQAPSPAGIMQLLSNLRREGTGFSRVELRETHAVLMPPQPGQQQSGSHDFVVMIDTASAKQTSVVPNTRGSKGMQ